MKISQEEIDAGRGALLRAHPANSSDDDIRAVLQAAYTVRKQRKAAKRERQRKEKDKQVVESVKAVDVIGPQLKEAIAKVTDIQGILAKGSEKAAQEYADMIKSLQNPQKPYPSKAPEWGGTFTSGDYEAANGKRVTIKTGQMTDFYGAHLRGFSDELQDGYHWFTDGKSDMALRGWDLIRPWPKPTEGERSGFLTDSSFNAPQRDKGAA